MRGALLALILVFPLLAGSAAAHEPDTFAVIVFEDRHEPPQADLIVNDSIHYINKDNRTNITHIIGFDLNGDGDFDDENEFSSGVLHYSCDWANDSDCRIAWKFEINSTDYVGNYILSDLHSDGYEIEVWLNISSDDHSVDTPAIGECFGDCEEDEVEPELKRSSQTDLQKGLMLAGLMMFGGASALFVATLMQKA